MSRVRLVLSVAARHQYFLLLPMLSGGYQGTDTLPWLRARQQSNFTADPKENKK